MKGRPSTRLAAEPRDGSPAFTLVELLVVVSILGVVIGVIGACLSGGIRVWDSAQRLTSPEGEVVLGLQVLEKDLANAFDFQAIPFAGTADSLTLAMILRVSPDDGKPPERRIGTVQYTFDRAKQALLRSQWVYPRSPDAAQGQETLIPGLEQFSLLYAATDREDEAGWQDSWEDATNRPAWVRIDLRFETEGESQEVTRLVMLPAAGP
jgi:prepilin-type N-terminal cleavage/methylation domain-containing protein